MFNYKPNKNVEAANVNYDDLVVIVSSNPSDEVGARVSSQDLKLSHFFFFFCFLCH